MNYYDWVAAFKAVVALRVTVHAEENASPAWDKLLRISMYCHEQAARAMNGGE